MQSLSASSTGVDALEPRRDGDDHGRDPIRLLLLTDTAITNTGGSERFLRNLVAGLPADRYRITLVQLGISGGQALEYPIRDGSPPLRIINWPVGRIYGADGWKALARLRRLTREEHFDIIQSQHEKSDLLNALVRWRSPSRRLSNRRDMGFKKSPRLRLLFRLINHRYDGLVAPAREILSTLAEHEDAPRQSQCWIANGVDTQRFRPLDPALRHEHRSELGLEPKHVAFVCVASFYPVKCHDVLVEAFAALHRTNPDVRLLLVGQGGLRDALESRVRALGAADAIEFLGPRSDIDRILPAMDAAMLTSSSEGMSNALLEAMSCGLPVAATAVGGNLQLVRHGHNGLQVPVGDIAATTEAMARLADSAGLRAAMGRRGRERVEKDFSLDGMVQAYDRLYRRLLGRN